MADKIINKFGTLVGWNNIKVNMFGRDLEGITELEYDDEQEMSNEFGAGNFPIGQAVGNYNAKAGITVYAEELIALQESLPEGKRLQDIPPFDIIVQYEYGEVKMKDVIKNCRMMKNGRSAKNNEGKMTFKVDLLTSHIEWNKQ
jgi:hypothetical protein